ncbi:MAG: CBS domain-containing protein [Acidobacteriota bacterium]
MPDLSLLPTARDVMVVPSVVLSPKQDLMSAIDCLVAEGLAAAPVVDGETFYGMLTEKDCLRILSAVTYEERHEGDVEDYCSAVTARCEPSMDLFRVADLFLQNNFPVLPVEEQGRLVGVVSRAAMLCEIQTLRHRVDQSRRAFESVAGRQNDRPRDIETRQRTAAGLSRDQLASLFRRFGG